MIKGVPGHSSTFKIKAFERFHTTNQWACVGAVKCHVLGKVGSESSRGGQGRDIVTGPSPWRVGVRYGPVWVALCPRHVEIWSTPLAQPAYIGARTLSYTPEVKTTYSNGIKLVKVSSE